MPEIGMGHNSEKFKTTGKKKPAKIFYQLEPAGDSILDVPPAVLRRRRLVEAAALADLGKNNRKKVSSGPLAVKVNDHHKRVGVDGKCRCHIGTADDLTTGAGDDDLSNHLYKADEPSFRNGGLAEYMADMKEEVETPDTSHTLAVDDIELEVEEELDDTAIVAPGAYYSTASIKHLTNISTKEKKR